MIPVTFQVRENGSWERWHSGHVDAEQLAQRVDIDNDRVFVNGKLVFALYFENGRFWNCKTGWQKGGML